MPIQSNCDRRGGLWSFWTNHQSQLERSEVDSGGATHSVHVYYKNKALVNFL